MNKYYMVILFILFFCTKTTAQTSIITINSFNGVWKSAEDTEGWDSASYFIFNNGKSVDPYFSIDNTIYIDKRSYGFCDQSYKDTIDNITEEGIVFLNNYKLQDTQSNQYQYLVIGDFVYGVDLNEEKDQFTLFGVKVFTYKKIKQLPPKLERRLRAECKKKNIDIDYFLGPEKPTTRPTKKGVTVQSKGKK